MATSIELLTLEMLAESNRAAARGDRIKREIERFTAARQPLTPEQKKRLYDRPMAGGGRSIFI